MAARIPQVRPESFRFTAIRDKIFPYSMRSRIAIAGMPLLKRFRRGRHDRGRRLSRWVI
jgi:hypothetical protein